MKSTNTMGFRYSSKISFRNSGIVSKNNSDIIKIFKENFTNLDISKYLNLLCKFRYLSKVVRTFTKPQGFSKICFTNFDKYRNYFIIPLFAYGLKNIIYGLLILGLIFGLSGIVSACCDVGNGTCYVCGQTIYESCTLNASLTTWAYSTCFLIGADNIVIDGAGYNLTGDMGQGIMLGGVNNVTIKNCTLIDYESGIILISSSNNTLVNNTANSNLREGIFLFFSSNNKLINNTANSNDEGIAVYNSANNTLTNNTVSSSLYGIVLSSSQKNTLTNNMVNNTILYPGLFLVDSSNNTITNNMVNSNSFYGLFLADSSNNKIGANTFCGNMPDIWIHSGTGNYGDNTCNSLDGYLNNNNNNIVCAQSCGQTGCEDADLDGYYGITGECLNGSDCNDNNASINPGAEIYCNGADENCNGFDDCNCFDNDGDGYNGTTIECPIGTDCNDNDPSIIPAVDNLNVNRSLIICANFYSINDTVPDGVIIINSSNIVFDCGGSTLIGNKTGYGVYNQGFDNVTIKNCNVMNYNAGIRLYSSSNNTLTSNTANDNYRGIYLNENSDFNALINNNITNNNNTGVYFTSDSDNNDLTSNVICKNGLDVNDSDSNSGSNNTCDTTSGWQDASENTTKCKYICGNLGPQANPINQTGAKITVFNPTEGIYVTGSGFDTGDNNVTICIVNNTNQWYAGMMIPGDVRVSGCNSSVSTNGDGTLGPVQIWGSASGSYDVVIDQDQDGYYNDTRDAVNSAIDEGFYITPEPMAAVLFIAGLSLLYGLVVVRKS